MDFSIHYHLIYIDGFLAPVLRGDIDVLSIAHCHIDSRQRRRTDIIVSARRTHWVESHAVEDVPRRHLSAIIVATQRAGTIAIELIDHSPHPLLALPPFTYIILEVGNMVARLIAVPVGSYASLYIARSGNIFAQFMAEERIQAHLEQILTH